jgi:hypothetical protein
MKRMDVWRFARLRSWRKSFSATEACKQSVVDVKSVHVVVLYVHGHPVNLKNSTTQGLPSIVGNLSFPCVWALSPIRGGSRTGFGGGGGVDHDDSAFGMPHCTFANGLAKPPSPPLVSVPFVFPPPNKPSVFGKEMPPNPARCRAILVPSLLNIFGERLSGHAEYIGCVCRVSCIVVSAG